jgi:ribonuclease BN (tRNA processing enzyme)
MLFTLEALNAEEGDCLILQYGTAQAPSFILLDGGPPRAYARSLEPRLLALRETLGLRRQEPLPLRLAVITHIDSDHIAGMLDLVDALRESQTRRQAPLVSIDAFWHNSFDDTLATRDVDQALAELQSLLGDEKEAKLRGFVAGTRQSRELRDKLRALKVQVNAPFPHLVMRPDDQTPTLDMGSGLRLTLLAPKQSEMAAFQKKWDQELKKAVASGAPGRVAALKRDTSVFNLSSICLLAELEGTRMLLTGDAHSDELLAGLEVAGKLPKDGSPYFVDLLKLQHHGSVRNVTPEFFERVVAEHYVISANGKHDNPDVETLEMLAEARGDALYTLHLTFPKAAWKEVTGESNAEQERREALKAIDAWLEKPRARRPKRVYRQKDQLGVTIALGSELLF